MSHTVFLPRLPFFPIRAILQGNTAEQFSGFRPLTVAMTWPSLNMLRSQFAF